MVFETSGALGRCPTCWPADRVMLQRLRRSTIPEPHWGLDLTDFDEVSVSFTKVLQSVTRWVSGEGPPWLYISGRFGSGKTRLAYAATIELMRLHRLGVIYRVASEVIAQAKRAMGREDDDVSSVIESYMDLDWLVLDDWGHVDRDWSMEQWEQMLGCRYEWERRTMLTSNVPVETLPHLSGRLASRLNDGAVCLQLNLEGVGDYRTRKQLRGQAG